METIELQNLQQALSTASIPTSPNRPITVFDISKLSHDENTFSDWYQYFLHPGNKYSTTFMDCLIKILLNRGKAIRSPSSWDVFREKSVETKRVDIVLESAQDELCIIIENKIWARTYNDLDTYSKYKTKCTQSPIGILLTLEKTTPSHYNFINITHKEWLAQVDENIKSDSSTEFFFLNQFIHAINNLYNDYTMNDQVNFFFENRDQVISAANTLSAAKQYIRKQLTDVSINLGLELSVARDKYFHYFLPEFRAACAMVAIQDLDDEFDGGANIVLQLAKEGIKRKMEFDEVLREKIKEYDLEVEPWGNGTTNYLHYGVKIYDTDSLSFYETIQDTVAKDLTRIFIPLLKDIQEILNKNVERN